MNNQVKCQCCGAVNTWQPIGELKTYSNGDNSHGYYEQFRCSKCGQVRTKTIKVIEEQRKGVVL